MIDWKKLPNVHYTSLDGEGNSPENKAWDNYVSSGRKPLQWLVDKYAKNRCWRVMTAKWDFDNKSLKYMISINAETSKEVNVTYDDICKEMDWKSFTILDKISCVPVEMTLDEVASMYEDAVAKTKMKTIQWMKDHPEALTKTEKLALKRAIGA